MNKKIFTLSLMLLSCAPIWTIPPETLKGLAEGGLVDDLFSPVHGFLAIETGTLERIRFYGHYGKVYEYEYDSSGRVLGDQNKKQIDGAPEFNPEWLHPIFKIKNKKKIKKLNLSKEETDLEISKNFDRQFEYHLHAISALVQWLFPSVDGVNLVTTCRNDIGHPSREMKEGITVISKKSDLEADLEAKKKDLKEGDIEQATKESEDVIEKHKKNITDLEITIKKTEFLPKILKAIFDERKKAAPNKHDIEKRVLDFISCIDPDSSGNKKTFLTILYHALIKDGTFSSAHSPLYPKHIALHALLGFLWHVAENKKQVADVLEVAGLLKPDTWKDQSYTKKAYKKIREKIQKRKKTLFKEKAYAGYAYTLYDSLYPEKISYGKTTSPNGSEYPDCGETMVRNFFNVVFYQKGEGFCPNLSFFKDQDTKGKIAEFYTRYPNVSAQKTLQARQAWADIVSNLKPIPNLGNGTQVQYNQHEGDQSWEIDSRDWGIGNILNVIANLTGNESLGEAWITYPGSDDFEARKQEFYDQIKSKLNCLCKLFSRDEFQLAWSRYDNGWEHDYDKGLENQSTSFEELKMIRREPNEKFKEISSSIGDFYFVLKTNNTEEMPRIFDFVIKPMHFDFNLHKDKFENDWRKKALLDIRDSDFLSTYYSETPSLFLSQSIQDMQKEISEGEDSDLWILRILYKRFAHQIENEFHQSSIASSLHLIKNKESSFFKDFGRTLLVERLKGKDSPYSNLFTCEFTDKTPNSLGKSNNSILIDAVEWGFSEKTIKWLLKEKAPLANYKDFRTSVLHTAISYAPDHIIELLIKHVVDSQKDLLNIFGGGDDVGNGAGTPLHFAAEFGTLEAVKLLVANGAKTGLKDEDGKTPLSIARKREKLDKSRSEIVAFLTQLGNLKKVIKQIREKKARLDDSQESDQLFLVPTT